MESKEFREWYLKEFDAKNMPAFEDGGYPRSQRAQFTWRAWSASRAGIKPLSSEVVNAIWKQEIDSPIITGESIARRIEKAHGIL